MVPDVCEMNECVRWGWLRETIPNRNSFRCSCWCGGDRRIQEFRSQNYKWLLVSRRMTKAILIVIVNNAGIEAMLYRLCNHSRRFAILRSAVWSTNNVTHVKVIWQQPYCTYIDNKRLTVVVRICNDLGEVVRGRNGCESQDASSWGTSMQPDLIGFSYCDSGRVRNRPTCVGHSSVRSRVSAAARRLTELATASRHRRNLEKKLRYWCTNE